MEADRRLAVAVGFDVFVVVLFVAIGRRNHDESSAFSAVLKTAVPFLVGLGAGWVLTRAWRHPMRVATGLAIWPTTVLVGMLVRRLVFDRGTATSFVIVATVFLGACFVGWRIAAQQLEQRRAPRAGLSRRAT